MCVLWQRFLMFVIIVLVDYGDNVLRLSTGCRVDGHNVDVDRRSTGRFQGYKSGPVHYCWKGRHYPSTQTDAPVLFLYLTCLGFDALSIPACALNIIALKNTWKPNSFYKLSRVSSIKPYTWHCQLEEGEGEERGGISAVYFLCNVDTTGVICVERMQGGTWNA